MEPEGFHPLPTCALTFGRLLSPATQLSSASTARQSPASQVQEYLAPRFSQAQMPAASHGCEGPRRALSLRKPRSKWVNTIRQLLLHDSYYSYSFSHPHITSHKKHLLLQSPQNWLIIKCQPKQQNFCNSAAALSSLVPRSQHSKRGLGRKQRIPCTWVCSSHCTKGGCYWSVARVSHSTHDPVTCSAKEKACGES